MLPFWVHSGEYSKCDSAYSKSNLGFLIVNVKKGAHKRKHLNLQDQCFFLFFSGICTMKNIVDGEILAFYRHLVLTK